MISVKVYRCRPDAAIPQYMSCGAAGCDVRACLESPLRLEPGARAAVPTGLKVEIPPGFEIQVRPRSGLALKQGLTVVNAPGTIDSDYRGEVAILMINLSQEPVTIQHGDRIAQWVVGRVEQVAFDEVDSFEALQASERGAGGFGSTGVSESQRPLA